jgi:hypothetical protein
LEVFSRFAAQHGQTGATPDRGGGPAGMDFRAGQFDATSTPLRISLPAIAKVPQGPGTPGRTLRSGRFALSHACRANIAHEAGAVNLTPHQLLLRSLH